MFNLRNKLLLVSLCLWMGTVPLFGQTIPRSTPGLEDALLAVLASDATHKEKVTACRELGVVGTAKSLPVLGTLLADEKLSHMVWSAITSWLAATIGSTAWWGRAPWPLRPWIVMSTLSTLARAQPGTICSCPAGKKASTWRAMA